MGPDHKVTERSLLLEDLYWLCWLDFFDLGFI
jgi:hypothetical protein